MDNKIHALAPPDCPWWCTETHSDGWDAAGGQLTKHCRRDVLGPDDTDGQPVEIELARFASVEDDGRGVVVCEPVVRFTASAPLDIESARSLIETLGRLADMSGEPGIVAA